jgi:hypothetical protein
MIILGDFCSHALGRPGLLPGGHFLFRPACVGGEYDWNRHAAL